MRRSSSFVDPDRRFGQLFHRRIKSLGITQTQAAERLNCHQGYVSALCNGKRPWKLRRLKAAAEILGIPLGQLLNEALDEQPKP